MQPCWDTNGTITYYLLSSHAWEPLGENRRKNLLSVFSYRFANTFMCCEFLNVSILSHGFKFKEIMKD